MRPAPSVPEIPVLAPSEFRIFALLDRHGGPLTIRDIGQRLARQDPNFSQGYNTLGTLLHRMADKGYVRQEGQAGAAGKLYRSVVPYEIAVGRQLENLLETLPLSSPRDLKILAEVLETRRASLSDPGT